MLKQTSWEGCGKTSINRRIRYQLSLLLALMQMLPGVLHHDGRGMPIDFLASRAEKRRTALSRGFEFC